MPRLAHSTEWTWFEPLLRFCVFQRPVWLRWWWLLFQPKPVLVLVFHAKVVWPLPLWLWQRLRLQLWLWRWSGCLRLCGWLLPRPSGFFPRAFRWILPVFLFRCSTGSFPQKDRRGGLEFGWSGLQGCVFPFRERSAGNCTCFPGHSCCSPWSSQTWKLRWCV